MKIYDSQVPTFNSQTKVYNAIVDVDNAVAQVREQRDSMVAAGSHRCPTK